jgi:hypothetical protein
LDAVVKWNFKKDWSLWVGQTKLPGNLERVVSSMNLQFVDRSNVNSAFNLDRDVGFQLRYSPKKLNFMGAVSMGEGRNLTEANAGGYNYTGRVEYLPFGKFADKGDRFFVDLRCEKSPKLALGVTYDYNQGATRSGGQLGEFYEHEEDLKAFFFDAHFKYNGLSSLVSFARKTSDGNPTFVDGEGDLKTYSVGHGVLTQVGYLFRNNFEVAGRYSSVTPEKMTLKQKNTQYTVALSKYIIGHSLKIQSDVTLAQQKFRDDQLVYRLQVELAF